jgi:hypothetical protein
MAVSRSLRLQILRRDNHTCQACGAKAPDVPLQIDHVVPVALGGSDEPSNLRTLCEPCNSGKSATPPDAATVAQVSEDALRWSQAIKSAADKMLADRGARSAEHAQFDEWWNSWTYNDGKGQDRRIPRDPDWQRSVTQFLAAGLPLEILKDCLDVAMSRQKVRAEDTWRYFCGIAWGKVRELQDAAKKSLRPELNSDDEEYDPNEDPRLIPGRESLANELLAWFGMEEIEHFLQKGRDWYEEHEQPSEAQITIHAGLDSVTHSQWSVTHLAQAVDGLLELFTRDEVERAGAEARERLGDEFMARPWALRKARYLKELADRLLVARGRAYLDTMRPEERAEWIDYAVAWYGPVSPWDETRELSEDSKVRYAAHCARVIQEGRIFASMCLGAGEHIEACPSRAAFRVTFEELKCCTSDLPDDQHPLHGLCHRHLEEAVENGFKPPVGDLLTVRDFTELSGS